MRQLMIIVFSLFAGCQSQPVVPVRLQGQAQGTTYSIVYYGAGAADWQAAIDSLFEGVNQSLSTYHATSTISRFNEGDSLVSTDTMFRSMLTRALDLCRLSGGSFDPTVMPLVRAWGFGPDNSLVPRVGNLDSIRALVGPDGLRLATLADDTFAVYKTRPGVQLDFNAIAQGYTVDLVADLLRRRGIDNYLVEIGGETRTRGRNPEGRPWTLGIEKPIDIVGISELATLVEVSDRALATSGNYRKYYEKDGVRYAHTIDPATGRPVQHTLLSVSVLAPDATLADAFATAFMVMGEDRALAFLAEHPDLGLEACFISGDPLGAHTFRSTPGMAARLREP
ncbi:MAG: FAD:protein FMN transferase [Bacteroidia bacterium]